MLSQDGGGEARQFPPEKADAIARGAPLIEVGVDGVRELGSEIRRQEPDESAQEALEDRAAAGDHGRTFRSVRVVRAARTISSSRAVSAATTFRPNDVSR
jgi:hypothetical protein